MMFTPSKLWIDGEPVPARSAKVSCKIGEGLPPQQRGSRTLLEAEHLVDRTAVDKDLDARCPGRGHGGVLELRLGARDVTHAAQHELSGEVDGDGAALQLAADV